MSKPWTILLRRYGAELSSPSKAALSDAVREVFHEDLAGITEGDYVEHGAASLRYGFDEGPMYVIEITRSGNASFEQWADQDYRHELGPSVTRPVNEKKALELWLMLSKGEIENIRAYFR